MSGLACPGCLLPPKGPLKKPTAKGTAKGHGEEANQGLAATRAPAGKPCGTEKRLEPQPRQRLSSKIHLRRSAARAEHWRSTKREVSLLPRPQPQTRTGPKSPGGRSIEREEEEWPLIPRPNTNQSGRKCSPGEKHKAATRTERRPRWVANRRAHTPRGKEHGRRFYERARPALAPPGHHGFLDRSPKCGPMRAREEAG